MNQKTNQILTLDWFFLFTCIEPVYSALVDVIPVEAFFFSSLTTRFSLIDNFGFLRSSFCALSLLPM